MKNFRITYANEHERECRMKGSEIFWTQAYNSEQAIRNFHQAVGFDIYPEQVICKWPKKTG